MEILLFPEEIGTEKLRLFALDGDRLVITRPEQTSRVTKGRARCRVWFGSVSIQWVRTGVRGTSDHQAMRAARSRSAVPRNEPAAQYAIAIIKYTGLTRRRQRRLIQLNSGAVRTRQDNR